MPVTRVNDIAFRALSGLVSLCPIIWGWYSIVLKYNGSSQERFNRLSIEAICSRDKSGGHLVTTITSARLACDFVSLRFPAGSKRSSIYRSPYMVKSTLKLG